MQFPFLPEVENVLRTAGWFPGRKIDAAGIYCSRLRCPLFPAAQQAIEEFGNLYFSDSPYVAWRVRSPFCINPAEAWYSYWPEEELEEYQDSLHCRVYPLGFSGGMGKDGKIWQHEASSVFLMDENKRVFSSGYEDYLLGDSIEAALSTLILQSGSVLWDLEKDTPRENQP
ncbi:MAG TPA: SUKH-3 domain-containing protein [Abditibacteriaceae bacterium]|jgi:hypothetical protein